MPDYEWVSELFDWDTIHIDASDLLKALKTVWGALGDIYVTFGTYTISIRDGSITILVASAIIDFFSRVLGLKVGVDMGEARVVPDDGE